MDGFTPLYSHYFPAVCSKTLYLLSSRPVTKTDMNKSYWPAGLKNTADFFSDQSGGNDIRVPGQRPLY